MPAAAVIPAPIVYLNVVAVKKLVVEFLPTWSCFAQDLGSSSALKFHSSARTVLGRRILL